MSGGVGPPRDIGTATPADDEVRAAARAPAPVINKTAIKSALKLPTRGGFFTFRELNALAVIVVISAAGLVSVEDFAFFVFSLCYMYFISKFAFPPPPSPDEEPPSFIQKSKVMTLYVCVGALIGLFFRIIYIFHGIYEGDKVGIQGAAPHVFLLGSQVFMEGLASAGGFSVPIRVFVPVFYNSRRIFTIMEWLRAEISKAESAEGFGSDPRRLPIGRVLAVANMVYWSFNLFGFLLLVIPKGFKVYYNTRKKDLRTNVFGVSSIFLSYLSICGSNKILFMLAT